MVYFSFGNCFFVRCDVRVELQMAPCFYGQNTLEFGKLAGLFLISCASYAKKIPPITFQNVFIEVMNFNDTACLARVLASH